MDELTYWEAHTAAQAMEERGGHFAAALAKAYFYADAYNALTLRTAFAALFRRYLQETKE